MTQTFIGLVVALIAAASQPGLPVTYKLAALNLASQIITISQQQPIDASSTPIDTSDLSGSITTPEEASTAVTQAIQAAVPPPTCTLSATVVTFIQGTKHALFTWHFTEGATAEIDENGQPVDVIYGAGTTLGTIHTNDSSMQSKTYSLAVFGPKTYVMKVSNQGGSSICTASI